MVLPVNEYVINEKMKTYLKSNDVWRMGLSLRQRTRLRAMALHKARRGGRRAFSIMRGTLKAAIGLRAFRPPG